MIYLITFAFICLDYITGVLQALATKTFSSTIMREGLFHKVALVLVMLLGVMIDYAQQFADLGASVPVAIAACVYIILMEVGSVIENLCRLNPELMPDKLNAIFGMKGGEKHGAELH